MQSGGKYIIVLLVIILLSKEKVKNGSILLTIEQVSTKINIYVAILGIMI